MCEPVLDKENRTGYLLKMATQYNVNIYQEHWAIPEIIQAKQVTVVEKTWNFQGY